MLSYLMKYIFLLLFLGGCGYTPGLQTDGETFYLIEDDPNIVWHCWIDRDRDHPRRFCEKEEGFK